MTEINVSVSQGVPVAGVQGMIDASLVDYPVINQSLGVPWNRRLFAQFGDSMTANNNPTAIQNRNDGPMTWAKILAYQAFSAPYSLNYGVSGDTTALAVARLAAFVAAVKAANAGCVTVRFGANDITAGVAAATITANLQTIIDALTAIGVWVFLLPIPPRAGSHSLSTAALKGTFHTVNRFIRGLEATGPFIFVCDSNHILTDPTSAAGDCRTALFNADGLHPGTGAAFYEGRTIAAKWSALMPSNGNNRLIAAASDLYDATYNIAGNRAVNGLLEGTGGAKGTGQTGTVADSYTLDRDSASGIGTLIGDGAKVARTDGAAGFWQRVTLSGTPTSPREILIRLTTALTSGYSAGEIWQAACEVRVPVGLVGVSGLHIVAREVSGGSANQAKDGGVDTDAATLVPTEPWEGILLSPPLPLLGFVSGSDELNLRAAVTGAANIAASGAVDWGRISLRKIG